MTLLRGKIFKIDGEGELIGQKELREGIGICLIDDGIFGKLVRVENTETRRFENWQLGVDDIEVLDCDQKCQPSECICKQIDRAQKSMGK